MEIQRGGHTLIGFPALIDKGQSVEIEVFDEPDVAAAKHRAGLRRLVALQIKEPLKYLEKNIPDLQKMAMAYMSLGTADELRDQIRAAWGEQGLIELAFTVATARFYPGLKRGLGFAHTCERVVVEDRVTVTAKAA